MDIFQLWEFKEQNPGPMEIGQRHCFLLPKIFIIICILYYMYIYILYTVQYIHPNVYLFSVLLKMVIAYSVWYQLHW